MSVQGKTALVTGSTSGIGLGIASVLAAAGARDPQRLRRCGSGEGAGRAAGRPAGYHCADLGDAAQIADMMDYAEREFGGVDILINNAGIQHVAPLDQFPVEKWDAILAINLSAVFHTCRLALPGMRERNWGASSTWRRCTGWWRRKTSRPMWRPSMAWWG